MAIKNTNRWVDENGDIHSVPTNKAKALRFSKFLTHSRLRDYVFKRDGFQCQRCGVIGETKQPFNTSENKSFLVVDHKISIRNGGTHHPSNLQTLCDRCNASKVKEDIQLSNKNKI